MLNTKQQEAFDSICAQVLTGKTPHANILTAQAGCGKTFLTAQVVLKLLEEGVYITVVAPSHTARSVLMEAIRAAGLEHCPGSNLLVGMTVAAALGKRPDYNKKPESIGETPFTTNPNLAKLTTNTKQGAPRLLIIEEISMVGLEEVKVLLKRWGDYPVIVVGDFRQIPPVKALSARDFLGNMYKKGKLNIHKLTKNERSDGSTDIAEFANLAYDYDGKLPAGEYNGVFLYDSRKKFEKAFIDSVLLEEGQTTALAYRNKTVSKYLRAAAVASAGQGISFKAGDTVRLHEGITDNFYDPEHPGANAKGWVKESLANNGDHLTVLDYTPIDADFTCPYISGSVPCGMLTLDLDRHDGSKVQLRVPSDTDAMDPDGAYSRYFNKLLKAVTEAAEDPDKRDAFYADPAFARIAERYTEDKQVRNLLYGRGFYGVRGEFIRATKLHALTTHKAQGASIERVFVDYPDMSAAKSFEYKSLVYVALSRAKEELHILMP